MSPVPGTAGQEPRNPASTQSMPRPNWIEIELDALRHNLALVRARVQPGTKILLPVKADAYGHGSLACSYAAQEFGVDWLGVAHLFEGILLRQYGIRLPILVLGPAVSEDFASLLQHNLTPTVSSWETAQALSTWLSERNTSMSIHLKVDTGMHRYGLGWDKVDLVRAFSDLTALKIEGLFSHLATADMPSHSATQLQISRFTHLVHSLESTGHRPPLVHLANSAGTLCHPESHFDMVRPGIALYGYDPLGQWPSQWPLKPMIRLKATVRQTHVIPIGESVSYGHAWTATNPTKVASIAVGYGDGYMRGEVNQGVVLIQNTACKILGRVCMDTTMVDISHLEQVAIGEEVAVIDGMLDGRISMESLAEHHGTISYELACRIARRLYRLYWWNGQLVRWDDLRVALGVPDRT